MLSGMTAFAQLTDGFYRVQNKGSQRFLYVRDCTGEISTLGANMGAIELWPNLEDAISDPGSVIYLMKVNSKQYDLTSQGTGVYEISGRYMNISYDNQYAQVYSSGNYLYDVGNHDFDANRGILGAKTVKEMPGKTDYRLWIPMKVDSETDNFFGFKPTVSAQEKYYCPFYADFAYTPVNDDMKTWYVSKIDKTNAIAVISEITGTVARGQAVIVECASANPRENRADLSFDGGEPAKNNLLMGTYFDNAERSNTEHKGTLAIIPFKQKTMRILSTNEAGNLIYVNDSKTLPSYYMYLNKKWTKDVKCIPHNQSYLTVDEDCPATLRVMNQEEYSSFLAETPIHGIQTEQRNGTVYDLKGNAVQGKPGKGIYIRNNKKFIVK